VPPPPTPVQLSDLPRFFELYASKGPFGRATFHSLNPRQLLKWSGLDASRFSKVKKTKSAKNKSDRVFLWEGYPMANLHLLLLDTTTGAAYAALREYYKTDAEIVNDAAIQVYHGRKHAYHWWSLASRLG